MSNADVIRAHYDAGSRGDIEGMLAPLADDCRWVEMAGFPYAGTYVGPQGVLNGVFARLGADWKGYRVDVDEIVDGGDTVVAIGTYSGVFRATGKEMTARVVHVWKLRDGRVVGFEQFTDTLKVVEATE